MIRKDLLVKQFQELGKAIALLAGLRESGDTRTFEKEIAAASQTFTGLDLQTTEELDPKSFSELVRGLDLYPLRALGDLLFEKKQYYDLQGLHTKSSEISLKCLVVYKQLLAATTTTLDLEIYQRIKKMEAEL